MFYRHFHVRETSPGTHTFFPTYTCPVYCWRSVQLLDFSLLGNLIHASQPIRTTFTGQWFASGFLQTPPHDDALAIGCTLPTAGRVRDFHPLERAPAGRTRKSEYHLFLDDTPVLNISYYSFYGSVPNTSWLILTCMYPSLTSIRFLKFIRYISVLISSRLILLLSSSFISLS